MTEWSLRKSLFFLIGSTCLTLALFFGTWALLQRGSKNRKNDPRFRLSAIVQTGPECEALKTSYLAELLGLAADCPQSLYGFNLKEGMSKLLRCPLIAKASLKRMPPDALYVDYTVRQPVAKLGDYENIGLDREGYLFPLVPFFSPKELPEIYLGLPSFGAGEDDQGRRGGLWQTPMDNRHLRLAFEILQSFDGAPWKEGLRVKRIDVSNAFHSSLGQREIVLLTDEELSHIKDGVEVVFHLPKILRLAPKHYPQQLANFLTLRRSMLEDYRRQVEQSKYSETCVHFSPRIVDLRISQLDFVQNN